MMLGFGLLFAAILTVLQLAHQFGIPFTSWEGAREQHRRLAFQHLGLVADLQKERLHAWLNRRTDHARNVSESRLVRSAIHELVAVLHDPAGSNTVATRARTELPLLGIHQSLTHDLVLAKTAHEPYDSVEVADAASGVIFASSHAADLGLSLAGQPCFASALSSRAPETIGVGRDPENGRLALLISRVVAVAGKPGAVLIFRLNPADKLHTVLNNNAQLGQTAETVLVNQEGQILMPLSHTLPDGSQPKTFEYQDRSAATRLAASGDERVIRAPDYRGVPVVAACRNVRVAPGIHWALVVKQDEAEILAPLRDSARYTLLLELVGLALILGLSRTMAGHLSRPLHALCQTVEQFRAGDLNARALVPRNPEIGLLAAAFNAMAERVRGWRDQLESEVQARTAQFQGAIESLRAQVTMRQQAEQALRRERDNFLSVMNSMRDGVYVVRRDYSIQYINPALQQEFGPVAGRKCYEYFHGRSEACSWCRNPEIWAGNSVRWEWHSPRTGKTYDLLDTPFRNDDGSLSKLEIFRDITERKLAQETLRSAHDELELKVRERAAELIRSNSALQGEIAERTRAEAALRRANRALKTLSECNQALVEATDEADLLNRICQLITGTGAYARTWVGLADSDQQESIRPVAQAGFPAGYLDSLALTRCDAPQRCGAPAEALRSRRPHLCRLAQPAPSTSCDLAGNCLDHAAALALPVHTQDHCLGVLMIYSASPDAFDPDEVALLTQLGKDLAYGLLALRARAERDRAARAAEKWAQLVERAGWGVAVGSADGATFEMINPAYARMHGYSVAELTGRTILEVYTPEGRVEAAQRIRTAPAKGRLLHESTHLRKDGTTFPALVDVSIVRDERGCVSHRIVYTQDISERKSLEARILEISEREQQRIGRDLHDGLCQQLAAITYLCNASRDSVARVAPEPAALLARATQLLHDTMAQAHGLARGLHPVALEADGLMAALKALAGYFRQVYRVSARFVCSAPVLLDDNTAATHLYRIAQEAMNNARKHGQATRIIVRLSANPQAITLSVTDNGRGFPDDLVKSAGLGLETMHFRARAIGGTLGIRRGDEGGTRVTCSLPKSPRTSTTAPPV